MKMYYWPGKGVTNFGDELNVWLWPQILGNIFDNSDSELFLGIGSTLFDNFPASSRKIVFGAGYGGYSPKPKLDDSWKFYFVRGRLTARSLGIDPDLAIGDAAILIRSLELPLVSKKFRASFMPHWESSQWGNWADVCARAGVHLIDPSCPVQQILDDILGSEVVIAEAMHAAIVSDALRVPWIAIQPIRKLHRTKWFDWASALDISLEPSPLSASNGFEWAVTHLEKHWVTRLESYGGVMRHLKEPFASAAAAGLRRLAGCTPSLSSDAAIELSHGRMLEKLADFKRDFFYLS